MGRKARICVPGYYYHITARGNRRDILFLDEEDFITFFYILKKVNEIIPFELVSYCVMSNHYHLQLKTEDGDLTKVMFHINKRYATYFNNRYYLTGHVFEKRYFSGIITDAEGMLEVSRYIHSNPVEANIVAKPEEYLWSSFVHYESGVCSAEPYMNTDALLEYFQGTLEEKRKLYCGYVKGEVPVTARDLSKE